MTCRLAQNQRSGRHHIVPGRYVEETSGACAVRLHRRERASRTLHVVLTRPRWRWPLAPGARFAQRRRATTGALRALLRERDELCHGDAVLGDDDLLPGRPTIHELGQMGLGFVEALEGRRRWSTSTCSRRHRQVRRPSGQPPRAPRRIRLVMTKRAHSPGPMTRSLRAHLTRSFKSEASANGHRNR